MFFHLGAIELVRGSMFVLLVLAVGGLGVVLARSIFAGARRATTAKRAPATEHVDAWALAGQRMVTDELQRIEFPDGFPDSGDSDSQSDDGVPEPPTGLSDTGSDADPSSGGDSGGDGGDGGSDGVIRERSLLHQELW